MYILLTNGGEGCNSRLLGVPFDHALSMKDVVGELVCEVRWKLTFIKAKYCRISNTEPLLYIMFAIMFWHHWTQSMRSFSVNWGYPKKTFYFTSISHRYRAEEISRCLGSSIVVLLMKALTISKLSSQHHRREIGTRETQAYGMHGSWLTSGTNCSWRLSDALGLIWVYNREFGDIINAVNIKDFQRSFQMMLKPRIFSGCDDWKDILSFRVLVYRHFLR